jgi:glycosyltransferase
MFRCSNLESFLKVTVITVSFNSARTIGDTLASMAAQTHPDIEHLVIDGGSTDGTVDIVKGMGTRVARLVSEPDNGIYDAMNKGLKLASGDFVGFLNADDMLASPNAVAAIANVVARDDIDAVFGDLVYVRQDRPDTVLRYWRCGSFARSRLRFGWMPPHPTFYVRRSLLAQIGGFDSRMRIAADYDFLLRCLQQPGLRVAYVPQVLVKMRTGGASNRSLRAIVCKSREDLQALHRNRIGGVFALMCKNLRKLPQFLTHR